MTEKSTLYVVATPVGNLQDFTYRAVDVLKQVDLIVAEDTRHSRKLLDHYGIDTTLMSLHQHNEQARSGQVVERLQLGASVALISDAGTPAISDPGYILVQAVSEAGLSVRPVPGASSLTAALSVSGLPADKFHFYGFLPSKAGQRQAILQDLVSITETFVFFEAPHRILALLTDIDTIMGAERQLMIGREMCKFFETYYRGTATEIIAHLHTHTDQVCGEFVVCVAGSAETTNADVVYMESVLTTLLTELPISKAVKLTTKITGHKRNAVYQLALQLSGEN